MARREGRQSQPVRWIPPPAAWRRVTGGVETTAWEWVAASGPGARAHRLTAGATRATTIRTRAWEEWEAWEASVAGNLSVADSRPRPTTTPSRSARPRHRPNRLSPPRRPQGSTRAREAFKAGELRHGGCNSMSRRPRQMCRTTPRDARVRGLGCSSPWGNTRRPRQPSPMPSFRSGLVGTGQR